MEPTPKIDDVSNVGSFVKTDKVNKCNQCDYASTQAVTLKAHLKTHSGEGLISCNQCNYVSTRASDLRRHLKIHNGENSNKWNQCIVTYVQCTLYIRDDRIMPKNNKYARVVTFFHLLHLRHRPNVQASSQAGHLMIHLKMHRRDLLYRCIF